MSNENDEAMIEKLLPLRMISVAVRGFGRGSKDLGIATANLDTNSLKVTTVAGTSAASPNTNSPSEEDNNNVSKKDVDDSKMISKTTTTEKSASARLSYDDLPCGIYWGYCRIGEKTPILNDDDPTGVVYKAAISIGYSPTYGNEQKTVEPHLIAPTTDPRRHASHSGETILQDFYDQPIRLSVVGYLRPELPFEGLEKLVLAIKNDISRTEKLAESVEKIPTQEREWVASDVLI